MSRSRGSDAWRPSATMPALKLRARMLASARNYFATQNVLEVETPMLSRHAVSDVNIESIEAHLELAPGTSFYLHTSPEFCMKRLLAAGAPDIYQLGKVFRDGERGHRHQPEFTLAEWYRHGFGLEQIINDTLGFIREVLGNSVVLGPTRRISYREAFENALGIDPISATIEELAPLATARHHLNPATDRDKTDWLDLLLCQSVAPAFDRDCLTVLHHYPAEQAALARVNPDDPTVADRFEVFRGDLELANGYVELGDAAEQRERCNRDQAARQTLGRTIRPLDRDFLDALQHGLPACAGVAVGFDRLVMIAAGADHIGKVTSFIFNAERHT